MTFRGKNKWWYLAIVATEFVVHLVWEYTIIPYFIIEFTEASRVTLALMAAAADTFAIVCANSLISYVTQTLSGFAKLLWYVGTVVLLAGMVVIVAEMIALRTGMWSYTPALTIIPWLGVAVLPVQRFLIVSLLVAYVTLWTQRNPRKFQV